MTTKDSAYKKISQLVERFTEQYASYKKAEYNETQTRRDFIDPFFKALGWDVDNEMGNAEAYREVIHEDRVKIGGKNKAPDYSFKLPGGKKLFFVEAKKPSIVIKDDIVPAYQLRRYGWSAKMAVSIITDFEEFAIYDCTKRPNPKDSASVARVEYLTYTDYLNKFDFIWDTFSKEKVLKGSFDKFIEANKTKKGTQSVDSAFLESLDTWRTYLATSISWNNKEIDEDELNFVVQHTIDRLIFLRIAEDRGIEPYGNLQNVLKGNYYENLFLIFKEADDKYNSGLFDFKRDKISKNITIENKVIKSIIDELYYPLSQYAFNEIAVEILGSAYEQFLGKTITIDKAHRAKIELKPEVRKAGGVYYTPQYIVEYIVENTIGKLVENKKPDEVKEIKILDPACGSGSFLIGAYQYLLNWHIKYYTNNKAAAKKDNAFTPTGTLTTTIKKQILLNNIYGVDLDANAVEVTKLSLLLKCMEGETSASIAHQHSMFNERVLPTLDNNIKSGNSLIDFDYYDNQIDFGEDRKIKPFNWQKAFPEVFNRKTRDNKENLQLIAQKAKQHAKKAMEYAEELEERLNTLNEPAESTQILTSGFDVVIGNPPYLKLTANNLEKEILLYFQNKYASFSGGSSKNLFQLFLEKTIDISIGYFAFIIPESLLTTESNGKIRELLLQNFNINSIVTFDHFVFQDATIGTTIVVGEKSSLKKTKILKTDFSKNTHVIQEITLKPSQNTWDVSFDDLSKTIFKKLLKKSILMVELVEMSKGMVVKNRNEVLTQFPTSNSLPFLLGNCMQRYFYAYDKYAEYDILEVIGGTRNYIKQTKTPRLLIRRTGSNLCVTYSENAELIESTIYILRSDKINLKYLLGLLNSKLLSYYLSKRLITNTQGFPQVLMGQLEQLPIIFADNKTQADIIKLVEQLLLLNKEKQGAKLPSKIETLANKIDYCEAQINNKVYELYELTNDEIKIVEGK